MEVALCSWKPGSGRTGGELPAGWWEDSGLKETGSLVHYGFAGYDKDTEERCEGSGESWHAESCLLTTSEAMQGFDFEGLPTSKSRLRKEGSAVEWLYNLGGELKLRIPASPSNRENWGQRSSSMSRFPHL